MASSSTLFLASVLAIFITLSNAITNQQINQICAKTVSKNTCFQVLHSTRGVITSDLKGVGGIVLDVSNSKLTSTKSIIPSLIAKTTDPSLKRRYRECTEFLNGAGSAIGEAKYALNHNDFGTMNIRASGAQTGIDDCTDSLKDPPADRSDLTRRSQDVIDTLSIALVISNML